MGVSDDNAFLQTAFFKPSFDFMLTGQESDFFFHSLTRPVNLPPKRYGFFTILLDVKQGEFESCY
jgi:hypothetical protein